MAFRQLVNRLSRESFASKDDAWRSWVDNGLKLLDAVVTTARDLPIESVDAFVCSSVMEAEDWREVHYDHQRYERKMTSEAVHPRTARVRLLTEGDTLREVSALLVSNVQNAADPDRCIYFKDWARSDQKRSPEHQGFVLLSVFMEMAGGRGRGIISVRPDSGVSLKGLGERLDAAEAEARKSKYRMDDRVTDPVSLRPRVPRVGYPNADPWYDGRAHGFTIVDAPNDGTLLSADQIETILLEYANACEVTLLPVLRVPRPDGFRQRVAVLNECFDPPTLSQRQLVQSLIKEGFQKVIVLPRTIRFDAEAQYAAPVHRATLTDLTFGNLDCEKVIVDLHDLEFNDRSTPDQLRERWGRDLDLFPVVCVGAETSLPAELPPRAVVAYPVGRSVKLAPDSGCRGFPVAELPLESQVREKILNGAALDGQLTAPARRYIERYGLYTTRLQPSEVLLSVAGPRLMIVSDERKEKAKRLREKWEHLQSADPELILVLGGDGTMLRAIWQHWEKRLPFLGLNCGHLGFLMNEPRQEDFNRKLLLRRLPMLRTDVVLEADGRRKTGLAFGDAWVERASGQAAWVEVRVNDTVGIPRVVADGLLVATPAGSSAYAAAMGGVPVPLTSPVLTLVGSNVFSPDHWKPLLLPDDCTVTFRNADEVGKRPIRGFMDGSARERIREMRVRLSTVAAVEMVFTPEHDPLWKVVGARMARIEPH